MKLLFLDESGDHNLSVIDSNYPLFVLGGVVLDRGYAEDRLEEEFRAFKIGMFANPNIVLHTADIARNRNGFERMADRIFREEFFHRINAMMRSLEFTAVACVVRKELHLSRYGVAALDPYLLSLDVLVERFCFEIGHVENGGAIVAEKRDATLDHELELAWLNLKIQGTQFLKARDVEKRIANFALRSKKEDIAGLQLADLVVSPIGRHVLGKPDKADWEIVSSKFRRSPHGRVEGYGLVVLPK